MNRIEDKYIQGFLDNMKETDSLEELNVDRTLIKRILKRQNVDWTRDGQTLST